jgi:2-(1,2-epoxy-1,2-dihydrophenyl)acetyl-CoA isomerase
LGDDSVLYEAREGVAVITLNRPEVLNAFTPAMLGALHASLHRAVAGGQRAVLLTGAGRGFSAGQDLASIQGDYADGGAPDFVALLREHFHPVLRGIRTIPMPVIAAVNGVAAGAGMSVALACDIRIAADNARFATSFTKIGLVPDAGMAYTLPRLVGAGRANWLLMQADPLDAATALDWGMVDKVVPAADLAGEAFELARKLAAGPTQAFVLTRNLLDSAASTSFDHLLDIEADVQAAAGATADHKSAVASFLAKQPPTFKGE